MHVLHEKYDVQEILFFHENFLSYYEFHFLSKAVCEAILELHPKNYRVL